MVIPFYQRGDVTIYHGDCLKILPTMEGIDAVVTDPPYGQRWVSGLRNTLSMKRALLTPLVLFAYAAWWLQDRYNRPGHGEWDGTAQMLGGVSIAIWAAYAALWLPHADRALELWLRQVVMPW